MLVLSRKENESVRLGNSITVTIVRVAGDKVRLGIQAPADMLVLRDELQVDPAPVMALAADSQGPAAPKFVGAGKAGRRRS